LSLEIEGIKGSSNRRVFSVQSSEIVRESSNPDAVESKINSVRRTPEGRGKTHATKFILQTNISGEQIQKIAGLASVQRQ
jgi:hypothetical protein